MAPKIQQSTPGRFPYTEPTTLPAHADLSHIVSWLRQFVPNFRDYRRRLEQSIPTSSSGGGGAPIAFVNGRFKTDAQGNVWLQLKDSVDGLYRSVFTENGVMTNEKNGEP